jgi:diguanylate cyclase (GGDEF)-like protein/PAS domain S-box-containing protein
MENRDIDAPRIRTGIASAHGKDSFGAGSRAALAALANLGEGNAQVLFVHLAACFDPAEVLRGVRTVSRGALVIGATTAGEICGSIRQGSVVVTAIASPHVRAAAALGRDVATSWSAALGEAMAAPELRPFLDPSPEASRRRIRSGARRFAVIYAPGDTPTHPSTAFEIVEAFRFRTLGRIPVLAGGAGHDEGRVPGSTVLAGEQAVAGGLVLALFETELEFGISIAHGFRPTGNRMRVDAAEGRELLLVDGCAASHVLGSSSLLHGLSSLDHITLTSGKAFGTPDRLGEYTINVASHPTPTGGVRMSQPVHPGAELVEMEVLRDPASGGAAEAIRKAMLRNSNGPAALVMTHYCALRQRILGDGGASAEIARIAEIAGGAPLAGFCSLGEGGLADDGSSRHSDASVAVLVLGERLSELALVARENARLLEESESLRELRKVTEALRLSESRMRETFDNAPIGMGIASLDGRTLHDANRALCAFLGYRRDEILARNIADLSHPHDLANSYEGMRRIVLDGANSYTVEKRYIRKDGSHIWGQATASAVCDERGEPRYLLVQIQDIERRKQAEDVLQETKQRLSLAMDASHLSLWDYDVADGCVAFDERWTAIVGGAPGVRFQTLSELMQAAHPQDSARFARAMRAAVSGRDSSLLEELRFRAADGSWKWIRCMGKVVERDARGRATRAIGTNLDITAQKDAEEKIRRLAFTDGLTGLPNRQLFEDRFEQQVAQARRDRRRFAVLFLDLDHFKPVNDRYGHDAGDWLLRTVSDRIGWVIRETDTLARIGGDEFVLLVPGILAESDARTVADKILAVLRTPFVMPSRESIEVSGSIGIAIYPDHARTLREMMRCGDQAMYLAKKSGRDAARLYCPEDHVPVTSGQ